MPQVCYSAQYVWSGYSTRRTTDLPAVYGLVVTLIYQSHHKRQRVVPQNVQRTKNALTPNAVLLLRVEIKVL